MYGKFSFSGKLTTMKGLRRTTTNIMQSILKKKKKMHSIIYFTKYIYRIYI